SRPPRGPALFPYTTLFRSRVVGGLQRHVERGEVVAGVVLEGDRRLIGIGVLRNEVAPAQLGRVDPELVRGEIDDALEEIARLGRSEEHTSELQSRENLVCR